ncbi:MAG: hypothetical protein L0322_04860 [Chloroflexi bacterium]|nr:hypothetical protein [Chloroflexota bacterium]MCI0644221.1 hypothetical protein [Chloroflexota bacterium]
MDGADLVIIRATDPAGRPATGERKVNGFHLLKMKRPLRVWCGWRPGQRLRAFPILSREILFPGYIGR